MNKFEKLIEYIINDEDQKARALFHEIVVEKSRDIYESIMDEESDMEEGAVSGNQVEDLTKEVEDDESHAMEADEEGEEEFELDGADEEGEASGEFGGEANSTEEEIEDTVMNIDAKLDELLAKFDEIMGGEEEHMGGEEEFGGEEPAGDEFGGEEEMGGMGGEEEQFAEGKNPFAGSGKSGSAKSGKSGASGSAKSGKSGSAKSGKSGAEFMREYVDRIGDIYGGQGDANEGDAVGTGNKTGKVKVNTKYTGQQTGPDFGGNAVKTDTKEQNQDGKAPTKASNEYNKGQGEIKSGNVNVPGGIKGNPQKATGTKYETTKGTDNGKTVGTGNSDKASVNKSSLEGQAGRPTGKK